MIRVGTGASGCNWRRGGTWASTVATSACRSRDGAGVAAAEPGAERADAVDVAACVAPAGGATGMGPRPARML